MKKTVYTTLIAFIAGISTVMADQREIQITNSYSGIKATAGVEVEYRPGASSTRVVIEGPAENISMVEVGVNNTWLEISRIKNNDKRIRNILRDVSIIVEGPLVHNFETSSGAGIKTRTKCIYKTRKVSMNASSGSDIKFDSIECPDLDVCSSSGADIKLRSVKATTISLRSSSGSDIKVKNIVATRLNADASSGSDIEIDNGSVETGNFDASSAADIELDDVTVRNKTVSKSSGGSVRIE